MGAIATVASSWLDRIESSRQGLIEAARTGNRVLAAFAQADARAELIASLKDEQIQARLLRITDPELDMVELVNSPTEQDRVRVCAIAILSGFVPGDAQFSIYGGGRDKQGKPRAGKLYTKEAGYRTLFGHLGIVPEVSTQHPEWCEYGGSGKKCWAVPGKASCVHNGTTYTEECYGADAVRIDGFDSDKSTAVAAKARRRLLQMLWAKLSPILNEPQADDETEPIEQAPMPQIAQQQPAPVADDMSERERQKIAFSATYDAIQRRVKDPTQLEKINDAWHALTIATDKETLREMYKAIGEWVEEISKRNVDELQRYCKWCAEGLTESSGNKGEA